MYVKKQKNKNKRNELMHTLKGKSHPIFFLAYLNDPILYQFKKI